MIQQDEKPDNGFVNPTGQTLLGQMHIDDLEIARRKELLGFTVHDAELLAQCRGFIEREIDAIVNTFYERQIAVDEIALIIGDAETLTRLRLAQTHYIFDLFSGFYDEEYVNNRLRIGLVHKRIGVEPKHYLSAMRLLKSLLNECISRNLKKHRDAAATIEALDKLLYLDTEFVFDTYIRSLLAEIESAKDKAERYARSLEEEVAARTRELQETARKDSLTGLYNQHAFVEVLHKELSRAKRNGEPLSLIYFDIDKFKEINDRLGHLAGNEVLHAIGKMLASIAREYDICCRYGGDEFCVALPATDSSTARQIADRIQQHMRELGETPLSIGIAHAGPETFDDHDTLIGRADELMYRAKPLGGNRIVEQA